MIDFVGGMTVGGLLGLTLGAVLGWWVTCQTIARRISAGPLGRDFASPEVKP